MELNSEELLLHKKCNDKFFPVLDLLEADLKAGCKLAYQKKSGLWFLVDKEGNDVAAGTSLKGMLVEYIRGKS